METIIKKLFSDLENFDYSDSNQISRFSKIIIIKTLKERLERTFEELLGKVAEKDSLICELTKKNQEMLLNYHTIEYKLIDLAELQVRVKKLEDENLTLKKRIKILISFEKNKESPYSERCETQLRTSSSLTSENNRNSQDKYNFPSQTSSYLQITKRIKSLEKGVNGLLDSKTFKPLKADEPEKKAFMTTTLKANSNRSCTTKSTNPPQSLLTFNHAYTKKNQGYLNEPFKHH